MKKKIAIAAAALLALAAPALAAGQNWLTTVAATASGHRLGNPRAKVQLMEFVSYTCPHCGEFFREADGPIKILLVQPGKAAVEIRHFIRDPIDLTAVVLVNCGDTSKFFGNHEMFFARQDEWLTRAEGASQAQQKRWFTGPMPQRLLAISDDLGFYRMMEGRGYTRTQLDQCLGDQAKIDDLVAKDRFARGFYKVDSTPSFVVNGKTATGVHRWAELQKLLVSAGT